MKTDISKMTIAEKKALMSQLEEDIRVGETVTELINDFIKDIDNKIKLNLSGSREIGREDEQASRNGEPLYNIIGVAGVSEWRVYTLEQIRDIETKQEIYIGKDNIVPYFNPIYEEYEKTVDDLSEWELDRHKAYLKVKDMLNELIG